jgi:hypothetical protein
MVRAWFARLYKNASDLSLDVVIPIFILSLLLEMADFFPTLGAINIWDEASYVHAGYQLLTEGVWPALAASPLTALLYAITTVPVINSPDFFVESIAIARIFLFTLIFFSVALIARELKPYANPWIMLALVFIVPVAVSMFLFPSDALFAGISGLAFWQMLAFYNRRDHRHLWWASALMGVAMLARAEGLLLIGVMLVVTLVLSLPGRRWVKPVMAVLTPFVILVGGYVLIYGLATGNFDTGLPDRTFNNFESGHEVVYSQTGIFAGTISARLESRKYFGTPEENNYSVFRAIRRNPEMYLTRLKAAVPGFIDFAIKAYGNKFILLFIWLSLRGLVALIKGRHFPLGLMGVLWFMPLGVGWLNTFFREGYFLMPFFVVFFFTSIGMSAIIENFDRRGEKIGLIASAALVVLISILAKNTSMLYRGVLFILGWGLVYVLRLRSHDVERWRAQALWLSLAMVLIIRGGYQPPALPRYGQTEIERSVYFLQDSLPVGSKVLAGAPANIWAARMTYYGINSYDIPDFADADAFLDWVQAQRVAAVFVDEHFPQVFVDLVNPLVGDGLEEVFASSDRAIRVYFLNEDSLK